MLIIKRRNTAIRTALSLALGLLVLISSGCGGNTPIDKASSKPLPLTQLNDAQVAQKVVAESAREKLFSSLVAELTQSMTQSGPAKSIRVCKTRAPEIAAQVASESGVSIGRTSFKLRNPDNSAPSWAAAFVEDQVQEQVAVELPDRSLGVLTPIRLMTACTMCHGTDEQILPEVKAAIVSNYPDDRATGFAEGDIRGYFWVEVPADHD